MTEGIVLPSLAHGHFSEKWTYDRQSAHNEEQPQVLRYAQDDSREGNLVGVLPAARQPATRQLPFRQLWLTAPDDCPLRDIWSGALLIGVLSFWTKMPSLRLFWAKLPPLRPFGQSSFEVIPLLSVRENFAEQGNRLGNGGAHRRSQRGFHHGFLKTR